MEENITTIEELNATIQALKDENQALSSENATLKDNLDKLQKSADETKSLKEMYSSMYDEARTDRDRVKGVITAINTLLAALK